MSEPGSLHDLKTLILSFHPVIAVETVEEKRLSSILEAVVEELGLVLFEWSVTEGLARRPDYPGLQVTTDPQKLLRHLEELGVPGVFHLRDFAVHLNNPVIIRQFREVAQQFRNERSTVILSGASIQLPKEIEHTAVRYDLALPSPEEHLQVIKGVVRSLMPVHGLELKVRREELQEILRALQGMTLNQARQIIAYAVLEDGKFSAEDIQSIIRRKAQLIRDGGLLEYYPTRDNHYELGGFDGLKSWLERAQVGFSEEAKELNLTPPRGILLVGVQGCGKSLAAKVIAREWKVPLLKLDAGRLFDKYVGESEKNFRRAVQLAEAMAPVVLWIDEIEKGMTMAGSGEAGGGVSRRLFGSFLTWLQEKRREVFVVATANDLSILPPELLRKGRFDEIFFVDLPEPGERKAIFEIHLKLRKQDPTAFDLDRLSEVSEGFSGAEIEQAVIGALYQALAIRTSLDTDLLIEEIRGIIPLSVTRREDVDRLREYAQGRFASVR